MKIELLNKPYKFLTNHSAYLDLQTAFLLTKQNAPYLEEVKRSKHHSIVTIDDVKSLFGIKQIKIIAITGTNGKTTTAAAIYSLLLDLGFKVGMQGTRGFFINDKRIEEKALTTPCILTTYTNIYKAVEQLCDFFIMEVSSHAIAQQRIEGLEFTLKIITNITSDHLDFHKTQAEYVKVKNSFFQDETPKLINKDDTKVNFNKKNSYTYSIIVKSDFQLIAYSLTNGISGAIQNLVDIEDFHCNLYGFFNLYNLTAAISAVKLITKKSLKEICNQVNNFGGVCGRMEVVNTSPLVIVDFAHTFDGMAQVLNALKEKDILVVFGAGGNRDKNKRPLMGKVAEGLAKKIYITSDNPRNEDPDLIIKDIMSELKNPTNVYINVNRKEAIHQALKDQLSHEVVLILGKGDEAFQIIYDKKFPFDDKKVVKDFLN